MNISIKNVAYSYSKEQNDFYLGPVDLDIPPGKLVCWCGPNGSGKSTLAKLLVGELRHISGEINFNKTWGSIVYHSQIPQNNLFPDLTIAEHFKVLNEGHGTNVSVLINNFPKLEKMKDEYPDELSGGQAQIAAFASLLVESHCLYVFDEVLNHLDNDLRVAVLEQLKTLVNSNNVYCVLVTHDIEILKEYADEAIFFRDGNIEGVYEKQELATMNDIDLLGLLTGKKTGNLISSNAAYYFGQRAPRYQEALHKFPLSRVLDFVPYIAALISSKLVDKKTIQLCDAFGGTGFIASGLSQTKFKVTVCDCCTEMLNDLKGSHGVKWQVTNDDFAKIACDYSNHFDAVFCHGGLHHVVEKPNHTAVDYEQSYHRQQTVCRNLSKLVSTGGLLVIADIPYISPVVEGKLIDTCITKKDLLLVLSTSHANRISEILQINETGSTLAQIQAIINKDLATKYTDNILRDFFDQFVAPHTRFGHTAVYPKFDFIKQLIIDEGFTHLGTIPFHGPWLFPKGSDAGWFFKEKFSFKKQSLPGEDIKTDNEVLPFLTKLLGTKGICRVIHS